VYCSQIPHCNKLLQQFSVLQSVIITLQFIPSLYHTICEYFAAYYKTFERPICHDGQSVINFAALLLNIGLIAQLVVCASATRENFAPEFPIAIDQLLIGPGCGRGS
jgi:hypothetical protein